MQFTIKGSHIIALCITVGIAAWMLGGDVEIGGRAGENTNASTDQAIASESADAAKTQLFRVSVFPIQPVERQRFVSVRGRTKADAVIPIRTETGGVLEKRLFNRGASVKAGDLVCVIQQGARKANLASAQARFEQMEADYAANEKLEKKGFVTKTAMRQKRFDLDAAKAQLEQARIELERTEVRANASGVVQDPVAEVGDVLNPGGACLTLIDSNPMYFTGQVSERDINAVKTGMRADVELVTGESISGKLSYISPSADPQTRTIAVEIELQNSDFQVREGITAQARIILAPEMAIRISPSWLNLADNGEIGVKTVDDNNQVVFKPVEILSQTNQGFWIAGLEAGDRVITLGQEYVISGETVEPVPATIEQAKVAQ